jgi:tetratricopeptide (TPR) repeat protein
LIKPIEISTVVTGLPYNGEQLSTALSDKVSNFPDIFTLPGQGKPVKFSKLQEEKSLEIPSFEIKVAPILHEIRDFLHIPASSVHGIVTATGDMLKLSLTLEPSRVHLPTVLVPRADTDLLLELAAFQIFWTAAAQTTETTPSLSSNVKAYVALGTALRTLGLVDNAVARFNDALKIDDNDPEAHIGLAAALADDAR